jgi:hypothetical protein
MYVGQFPEWHRFAEQAAATSLSDGDVRVIANSAADLANLLQLRPEIADPEVPRTIVALNALIRDPARATKKAAFAVLRTMENLVASAFRYGVEFLDETARLTSRDMAKAVSKALVIGVLSVALASATELMPVAVKLGEAAWMKSAAEIVERQIKHLEEQG